MPTGLIVKALSGFYYVLSDDEIIRCKPRGIFRHEKTAPLVGDRVTFTFSDGSDGTITAIEPRKNFLARPAVANIDQLIIVMSAVTPVADPFVLDRMISLCEFYGIEPVLCHNKSDMLVDDELVSIYQNAGYAVHVISAQTGMGMEDFSTCLQGKISAFAGNSGVGKSSIINYIYPSLRIKTGEVSDKLGRGRHTTRHVELYIMPDGAMIADTPGFSFFDPDVLISPDKDQLASTFKEFHGYEGACRFHDCSHTKEQGCAILSAITEGFISKSRHDSYCRLYDEAKKIKPWEREQMLSRKP